MIKAVVFDFDGLIIDTESVWYDTFLEVLQEYGGELTVREFAEFVGTDDPGFHEFLCSKANNLLTEEELTEKAHAIHKRKMAGISAREGVEDYLRNAKQMGLKIGLASSSSREWVEGFLKDLDFYPYFDAIKTKDDVVKVKPDPQLYIEALQALDVNPEEAIAFEDSVNGLKAAYAAGIHCVIVPNKVTEVLLFENHKLRINSMGDLPIGEVIKKIEAIV